MKIENILSNIGLNEKEAKTYLSSLELGKDTVFNIAQKSGIKRSTTYIILESLVKKGLINTIRTSRATYCEPVSPRKILTDIQQKESQIRAILPTLNGIFEAQPFKPKVHLLEGIRGMSEVYQQNIKYLKTGKETLCISSMAHFYLNTDEIGELLVKLFKVIVKPNIRVREIISTGKYENRYVKQVRSLGNKNHQIKRCPKDLQVITDTLIFGNKIAFFSTQKNFFVVLIESPEIVQSYKNIFEIMWRKL